MNVARRLTRSMLVGIFAAVWLLVLVVGLGVATMGLSAQLPYVMFCLSGTLAGSAVQCASRQPSSRCVAWLMGTFAILGLSRYSRGDESGLLTALMFGGAAVGSLVITLLPEEPAPEPECVERSWDED